MTGTILLEIERCANDCEVDYKEEDETREDVLDNVVVVQDTTGYRSKLIALFSVIGVCGVVLVGLLLLILNQNYQYVVTYEKMNQMHLLRLD